MTTNTHAHWFVCDDRDAYELMLSMLNKTTEPELAGKISVGADAGLSLYIDEVEQSWVIRIDTPNLGCQHAGDDLDAVEFLGHRVLLINEPWLLTHSVDHAIAKIEFWLQDPP
jgi:hypothetical protein